MSPQTNPSTTADWRQIVARYQRSQPGRAIWQLITTLVPLALLFVLGYEALRVSVWLTLALAIPTAGFLVRTFIIMHDCAHGSFLPWKRANTVIGWITGILTVTPFSLWRHDHALHHASSGDLDRRGHGDVDTLTVSEYSALSKRERLKYRLIRNPFVLFGLGPIHFVLMNRVPPHGEYAKHQRFGVWMTNLALAAVVAAVGLWVGFGHLLLVYGPAMYIAAAGGIWLFYVQHQFEGTYWQRHAEWDYATAAIRGSSYLKLPAVLGWFTGSIGVHHVHHLGPRIPNYALVKCHEENPLFHDVTVVTLRESIRTLRLTLWDDARQRLVGFGDVA